MMSDREVWLKAMAVVEAHGVTEAAPVMDTLLEILGDDCQDGDWMRVAAAVDDISDGQLQ